MFDSLTSMFQTIADCYEENIMTVDDKKNLECDFKEFIAFQKRIIQALRIGIFI